MRKRKIVGENRFKFISILFLFLPLVFSCSSRPNKDLPEVHPLSLLSEDSSIYVFVPVQNHTELTTEILLAEIPSLSKNDAQLLVSRIGSLYAGLGTVKDLSRLEIASYGNFPSVAQKAVLTKKNGWSKQSYQAVSSDEALENGFPNSFDYYVRQDTDFMLSFPSDSVVCTARKLFPLLEKYAIRSNSLETPYADFLTQESEDILFYITRPGQYLRNLIGLTINGSDAVYGKMIPAKNGDYELSFCVHITTTKAMRAFTAALELSFGMLGGTIKKVDDLTIEISGIAVSKNQIINLFTRDPITGKHFKVEGDKIRTE